MRLRPSARAYSSMAPRSLSLVLRRGNLQDASASALVTSANDSLVGNTQPTYWRFISRLNADGALRKHGGEELEAACLAIEPLADADAGKLRRDITRWTSGVKHGASKVVRCPAGRAVTTKAYGKLNADHVIHAVAPDSEFGYEGMYTGGLLDQRISGAVAGNDTPTEFAGGASDGLASQQFTPPDDLLLATYENALAQARRVQADSIVLCALGAGVKGWKPAISAGLGLEAIARMLQRKDETMGPLPTTVEFAIGGVGTLAKDCWKRWVSVFRQLLGAPPGLEDATEYAAEAARAGAELRWELTSAGLEADGVDPGLGGGTLLTLDALAEFQEMWEWRRLGKNGKDEPLTAEQELQAVGRRSTR